MKNVLILGVILFSGSAFAGEGWHKFSDGGKMHSKEGCASKKDKMAQFHKFHGKDGKLEKADKNLEAKSSEKKPKLEDFI